MSVALGRSPDLPGYLALTFPLMPVGSTSQRSLQALGFPEICLLTPLRCLYPLPVRQASALLTASFRFHLTVDTLAVQLTLPLAGCVEDFHLLVSAPCRAHNRHRGSGHPLSPAPPPYMRVRIRRFSSVELERIQQPRKTARIEVSNRKCGLQGRAVGQAPGAMGTAGGLCREVMSDVSLT